MLPSLGSRIFGRSRSPSSSSSAAVPFSISAPPPCIQAERGGGVGGGGLFLSHLSSRPSSSSATSTPTSSSSSPLKNITRRRSSYDAALAAQHGCRWDPREFVNSQGADVRMKTFEDMALTVRDRILYSEYFRRGMSQWERFPALSRILGGFRKGELTLVTGPTGSGKTTFLCEYVLDLAAPNSAEESGVRSLFASFEIDPHLIAKTMLIQHARLPLNRPEHHPLLQSHMDNFEAAYRDYLFWFPSHDPAVFQSRTSGVGRSVAERIVSMIRRAVYEQDIYHVVIDNLQYLVASASGARELSKAPQAAALLGIQDTLVSQLRQLSLESGAHITLVIHPRKELPSPNPTSRRILTEHSIYGGGRATQEADNILVIQPPYKTAKGDWRRYLWIPKNRYTGENVVEDRLRMYFDRSTLTTVVEDEKAETEEEKAEAGESPPSPRPESPPPPSPSRRISSAVKLSEVEKEATWVAKRQSEMDRIQEEENRRFMEAFADEANLHSAYVDAVSRDDEDDEDEPYPF